MTHVKGAPSLPIRPLEGQGGVLLPARTRASVVGTLPDNALRTYSCFKKIFCADKCAPVSNNSPKRNAQNIMLAESANGPYTS